VNNHIDGTMPSNFHRNFEHWQGKVLKPYSSPNPVQLA
jgi:hypothetical protein